MAKTKVVLHNAGFRDLRTSAPAVAIVREEAEKVAARAGEGFEALPMRTPRNRAHAIVVPVTFDAMRMNAKDNTLIRALAGGSGSNLTAYTSKSGKVSLRSAAEVANYTRSR